MITVGNLIDHAIKKGKIDVGENSSKSKGKGQLYKEKKKTKLKPYFRGIRLVNLRGTIRTRTIQTINLITQFRVIRHLLYSHIICLQITRQLWYKLVCRPQTIKHPPLRSITHLTTNLKILTTPRKQNLRDLQ